MNNKEFIATLSRELGYNTKETAALVNALVEEIGIRLEEENAISIPGFGVFEVKKKLERVLINPATKQRMLVPPKLSINFKPASILKEKSNVK